jgi:hypothetical protein
MSHDRFYHSLSLDSNVDVVEDEERLYASGFRVLRRQVAEGAD